MTQNVDFMLFLKVIVKSEGSHKESNVCIQMQELAVAQVDVS
jgi:hypothetical protein